MNQEQEIEKVLVEVEQEVFFAEDTNYRILRTRVLKPVQEFEVEDTLTITGHFPEVKMNHSYEFEGFFTEHSRYGQQFNASILKEVLPREEDNIIQYIQNLKIARVGKRTIEKLYDFLGNDILEIIADQGMDALKDFTASGWNEEKAMALVSKIQSEHAIQLYFFKLVKLGFPSYVVAQLHEVYGENLQTIVQTNAYQILEDFDGISIKLIDKIVEDNFPEQIKFRTKYAIVYFMKQICYQSGDSIVAYDTVKEKMMADPLQKVNDTLIMDALDELIQDKKVMKVKEHFYQLHYFFYTENNIALKLLQLKEEKCLHPNQAHHIDMYIDSCEESFGISYDEQQRNALTEAFDANIYLLTGGPGTGKTTIIKALLEIFTLLEKAENVADERILNKIALLAPTGRAAQRMLETTGFSAKTIHSFLGWDKHKNSYRFNEENPISAVEFVIVDESSMIDMWLLSALLKALPNLGHIIFVGDRNQLPSVGVGQVYSDLLESTVFPVTTLDKIFRQKENSTIIDVANQINKGEPSQIFFTNSEDYSFLAMQPQQLLHALEQICKNALSKGYEMEDIQILAPLYKTIVGIDRINQHMQSVFNGYVYSDREKYPGNGETVFLPNDKVIQLKNLPDFDVYNGDIGKILSIEKGTGTQVEVVIDFSGTLVIYSREEMKHISHAYCISIHKSQGSEFPLVIIPVFFQYSIMLYRQLIYTGASRAKKALMFLGQKDALLQSIKSSNKEERTTNLKNCLYADQEEVELPGTMVEAYNLGITGENLDGKTPADFMNN